MYPHDESAAFHLPAVYRNARRCRVNDAIAENYTRRGRASYSYTLESLSGIIHYSLIMIFAAFFVFFPPFFRSPAAARGHDRDKVCACTPVRDCGRGEGTSHGRNLRWMRSRRIALVCSFSSGPRAICSLSTFDLFPLYS